MSDPIVDVLQGGPPKWAAKERVLWVDFFQGYSDALIASALEENSDLSNYDMEALKEAVRVAGELADAALQEVQYRFHKHVGRERVAPAVKVRGRGRQQ